MQAGEVLRRVAFNALDTIQGGRLKKLKEANKREIVNGITPEYRERRLQAIMDFAKEH